MAEENTGYKARRIISDEVLSLIEDGLRPTPTGLLSLTLLEMPGA